MCIFNSIELHLSSLFFTPFFRTNFKLFCLLSWTVSLYVVIRTRFYWWIMHTLTFNTDTRLEDCDQVQLKYLIHYLHQTSPHKLLLPIIQERCSLRKKSSYHICDCQIIFKIHTDSALALVPILFNLWFPQIWYELFPLSNWQ